MLQFLRERRLAILALAVLASLFVLMAVQVRQGRGGQPEGFLLRFASPLVRAVSAVGGGISEFWGSYLNLRGTRRRNAELTEEVAALRLEVQKLEEAGLQNERLRALAELKQGLGAESVSANVIGTSGGGLSRTLLVDRGIESGLRPDMPVISAHGVVGRVWTVGPSVSKVQLITDVDAGTATLVQRTRVQGVLLGHGADLCSLEYVSTLDDVKEQDLLVTSGLDGVYPKGLPVGTVVEVAQGEGILRRVGVLPRVEFRRLEEVLILLTREIPLPAVPEPAPPVPPKRPASAAGEAP